MFRKYGLQITVLILYILWLTGSLANDTVYLMILFTCMALPLWIAGTTGTSGALAIYKFTRWILSRIRKKPLIHIFQKIQIPTFIAVFAGEVIRLAIHCGFALATAKTYLYIDLVATVVNEEIEVVASNASEFSIVYISLLLYGFLIFKVISSVSSAFAKPEAFLDPETALIESEG